MGAANSINDHRYSALIQHFATFNELLIYGYIRRVIRDFDDTAFLIFNSYFYASITVDHCYEFALPMITKPLLQCITSFYGDSDSIDFGNFQYDFLECRNNKTFQSIIDKYGDNFPEREHICLSVELIKINKRSKEQERTLAITNKAVYHLRHREKNKKRKYKKLLRRISIEQIVAITSSISDSNEFAFHIPQEYDTRYKSKHKHMIISVLASVYKKIEGRNLIVMETTNKTLNQFIVTKDEAKKQTNHDKLRRVETYVLSTDNELSDFDAYRDRDREIDCEEPLQSFSSFF